MEPWQQGGIPGHPPGTWQSLPSTPAPRGCLQPGGTSGATLSESSWKVKGFRFNSVLNAPAWQSHRTDPGQTDRQTQMCAGAGGGAKVEVRSLAEPQAPVAEGWGPYRQPPRAGEALTSQGTSGRSLLLSGPQ